MTETKYTMTVPEASKELGVHETSVRVAIKTGGLDAIQPRGKHGDYFINPDSVKNYHVSNKGLRGRRFPSLKSLAGILLINQDYVTAELLLNNYLISKKDAIRELLEIFKSIYVVQQLMENKLDKLPREKCLDMAGKELDPSLISEEDYKELIKDIPALYIKLKQIRERQNIMIKEYNGKIF